MRLLKIFLSPLGLDFEKSWSVRKLFRFYWLVSKDNQLSWMRSGDQLCSPGVFCLLIYRIFVLFRDKLMQLLPIYAKSRGRKKIVYLTLSYNGGRRFLFCIETKVRLIVSFAVVLSINILLKQLNFTKFQLLPQLGLIYYSSS